MRIGVSSLSRKLEEEEVEEEEWDDAVERGTVDNVNNKTTSDNGEGTGILLDRVALSSLSRR